jgi:hypothetical protein
MGWTQPCMVDGLFQNLQREEASLLTALREAAPVVNMIRVKNYALLRQAR